MVKYIIGHKNPDTDSICSAIAYSELKKLIGEKDFVPARCGKINNETALVLKKYGFKAPELIENIEGKEVILVDHNEMSQAPDGIAKAEVIEILDHHRIGDVQTGKPIFFMNKPLGSTATIIALEFMSRNLKPEKNIAGILLSAIISDTVILKSPITTKIDIDMAEELSKITGIKDIQSYGIEMFKAKSDFGSKKIKEIIYSDYKDFEIKGIKFGISQIELVDLEELKKKKDELLSEMKEIIHLGNLKFVIVLLTDIMKEGCLLYFAGEDEKIIEKAFAKVLKDSEVWLAGVMSRKKQVLPPIEKALGA